MIHIVLKLSKIFDGGKECLNSKEIIKCPQKDFFKKNGQIGINSRL